MTSAHVFVETNFLFGVLRMPSKRHRNAEALKARFDAGEIKLYVPYLCFQEARHLIAKSLPSNRCSDLLEFHRFAAGMQAATWDFDEVKKLLDAATGEVSRTKAVYQRELTAFATALGDGVLHGTKEVFEFLETLTLDDDTLKYNDKLILASVLLKAKELKGAGVSQLFFASVDRSDHGCSPVLADLMLDALAVIIRTLSHADIATVLKTRKDFWRLLHSAVVLLGYGQSRLIEQWGQSGFLATQTRRP